MGIWHMDITQFNSFPASFQHIGVRKLSYVNYEQLHRKVNRLTMDQSANVLLATDEANTALYTTLYCRPG